MLRIEETALMIFSELPELLTAISKSPGSANFQSAWRDLFIAIVVAITCWRDGSLKVIAFKLVPLQKSLTMWLATAALPPLPMTYSVFG